MPKLLVRIDQIKDKTARRELAIAHMTIFLLSSALGLIGTYVGAMVYIPLGIALGFMLALVALISFIISIQMLRAPRKRK